MKKIMMIAAMMVATLSANAQNEVGQFSIKPTAGINIASMTKTEDSKTRVGLVVGLDTEYGVAKNFSVTAGLLYSMQGVKFTDQLLGAKVNTTWKFDYINIPILAQYYIVPGLAIKAGLQPGFKVSSKVSAEASADGATVKDSEKLDNTNGFALAIPFGLSYEYKNFVLDARYNLGLTKAFGSEWNTDSKHSVFAITLGYKIPLN